MNLNHLAVALIATSTLSFTACSNNYQTSKDQRVGSNSVVVAPDTKGADNDAGWSYSGSTGPEYWGDIENASACASGQEQSPIDIKRVTATTTSAPTINYSQSTSLIVNDTAHTITYTPATQDNTITLNNERFELKQFHYHTPSEHQFGGQNYPAEIHFVHANSAGNLAVIGVMLEPGQANEVLDVLLKDTQISADKKVEIVANRINLSTLIPAMPTFYHYDGSLTTPPCSEQVQWYVTKQPLQLANAQLSIMTTLYEGNNRPVQEQGSRTVEQLSN